MNSEALFNLALGLQSPWEVREVNFAETDGHKELNLKIGFVRGAKFPDQTGALCGVHDTVSRQWQHLNFLNIPAICNVMSHGSKIPPAKLKRFRFLGRDQKADLA